LEFVVVTDKKLCHEIFDALHWAAYLKPEWSPAVDKRPVAYIVVLVREKASPWFVRDSSFAASNIVHVAESEGLGSCILCKIEKKQIQKVLCIPSDLTVDSVIALGYKAEQPVFENLVDTVKYYRDKDSVLHVPKRKLEDIIHTDRY
jgi:nitroreductase